MREPEHVFGDLDVPTRLGIVEGLQEAIAYGASHLVARESAAILERLGYPESAAAARRIRERRAGELAL